MNEVTYYINNRAGPWQTELCNQLCQIALLLRSGFNTPWSRLRMGSDVLHRQCGLFDQLGWKAPKWPYASVMNWLLSCTTRSL